MHNFVFQYLLSLFFRQPIFLSENILLTLVMLYVHLFLQYLYSFQNMILKFKKVFIANKKRIIINMDK